jgi:hypothetical protein
LSVPKFPTSQNSAAAVNALLFYDTWLLTRYSEENVKTDTLSVDSEASAHLAYSKSLLAIFKEQRGTVQIEYNTEDISAITATFMG